MKTTYEVQMARHDRNRWKRLAVEMYELINIGKYQEAKLLYATEIFRFTEEDR